MADGMDDEAKEHPIWLRILVAVCFMAMGMGLGFAIDGWRGLWVGAFLAVIPSLLALFVPPLLAALVGVLELLSYCAF